MTLQGGDGTLSGNIFLNGRKAEIIKDDIFKKFGINPVSVEDVVEG